MRKIEVREIEVEDGGKGGEPVGLNLFPEYQ